MNKRDRDKLIKLLSEYGLSKPGAYEKLVLWIDHYADDKAYELSMAAFSKSK